jgi:hypothetical protein
LAAFFSVQSPTEKLSMNMNDIFACLIDRSPLE